MLLRTFSSVVVSIVISWPFYLLWYTTGVVRSLRHLQLLNVLVELSASRTQPWTRADGKGQSETAYSFLLPTTMAYRQVSWCSQKSLLNSWTLYSIASVHRSFMEDSASMAGTKVLLQSSLFIISIHFQLVMIENCSHRWWIDKPKPFFCTCKQCWVATFHHTKLTIDNRPQI